MENDVTEAVKSFDGAAQGEVTTVGECRASNRIGLVSRSISEDRAGH